MAMRDWSVGRLALTCAASAAAAIALGLAVLRQQEQAARRALPPGVEDVYILLPRRALAAWVALLVVPSLVLVALWVRARRA